MIADLRRFTVLGEKPSTTCVGALAARAAATERVRQDERSVVIVNAAGESFGWWPELCTEPDCYAPAVDGKSTCAAHVEPRRVRVRRAAAELEHAARDLAAACRRADAAAPLRTLRRIVAFEVLAPTLDHAEVEAAVPRGARRAGKDAERVVLRGRAQALAARDALLRAHPGAAVEVVELPPEEAAR